ncbi:DUF2695 domain-containing protein [Margalitia sp. FSL K6-0131]|uniref:DUF2695 domain-containing protein n=1 Tax=Margalitia sp. FSL K6-0131 TaxID=2954604 RepID=UPI0030F93A22
MDRLNELKDILIKGQQLSMQGSLQRRAPSKKAVPLLLSARQGLKEFVIENSNNALAWRLLSQAEECLLNYKEAIICQEKTMELGHRERKDLKRLALLKEYGGKWEEINLSPDQLETLWAFLDEMINSEGCDHTHKLTKSWLENNVPKSKISKIIKAMRNQGGFCDCEVLLNVVD